MVEPRRSPGLRPLQVCLATLLLRGEGVRRDSGSAAAWYLRAARTGHPGAQRWLARCYAMGEGVPRDLGLAYRWITRACEAGDPEAARLRTAIEPLLTTRDRWTARS